MSLNILRSEENEMCPNCGQPIGELFWLRAEERVAPDLSRTTVAVRLCEGCGPSSLPRQEVPDLDVGKWVHWKEKSLGFVPQKSPAWT